MKVNDWNVNRFFIAEPLGRGVTVKKVYVKQTYILVGLPLNLDIIFKEYEAMKYLKAHKVDFIDLRFVKNIRSYTYENKDEFEVFVREIN